MTKLSNKDGIIAAAAFVTLVIVTMIVVGVACNGRSARPSRKDLKLKGRARSLV